MNRSMQHDNYDPSLHDGNLLNPVEEKYKIKQRVPKVLKEPKQLMLPSCSNSYIFQLTKTWDKGSRIVRERILKDFITVMNNATGPQLERELNNGASLFLTRISAWLRLTYLLGHDLALQLKALGVFVSAASGNRFLTEFLEVGGILTVLEILTVPQAKEADRAEALQLLLKVSGNGRKYKEFICESYGVRQITECLSKSKSEASQDQARNLLVSLGTGNPKFQLQVFKGLQTLISSPAVSPTSQQMASQALRLLLINSDTIPPGLIDAASALLRSQHMQVQYEGYELLKELVHRPECQDAIIVNLISILRMVYENTGDDSDRRATNKEPIKKGPSVLWNNNAHASDEQREKERLLCGYIQQTYALRLIGTLIASADEIAEKLIGHQLVSALLNIIANVYHPESQKFATENLIFLVSRFEYVAQALRKNMGQNFFDLLENKPDTFYRDLTKEQIRYLRRNNIKIKNSNTIQDQNTIKEGGEDSGSESDDMGISSSTRKAKHLTAFPGAYEPEGENNTVNTGSGNKSTPDQNTVKSPEVGTNAIQEKLQEQRILDSYEHSDTKGEPKKIVDDVYTQYYQSGVTATFPGNKYVSNAQNDRTVYEADLENFKIKNKTRADQKKVFEPEFTPEITARMQELRTDNMLFSHEKMLSDIDKLLNKTGADQMLTPEDKNMLTFDHPSDGMAHDSNEAIEPAVGVEIIEEEDRPLTAEEILDIEAEQAFKRQANPDALIDDWQIDLNRRKSTIRSSDDGSMAILSMSRSHEKVDYGAEEPDVYAPIRDSTAEPPPFIHKPLSPVKDGGEFDEEISEEVEPESNPKSGSKPSTAADSIKAQSELSGSKTEIKASKDSLRPITPSKPPSQ